MNFIQPRLIFLFFLLAFGLSACSMMDYIPFVGKSSSNQVASEKSLAYFVPDQRTEFLPRKTIKVNGDLNEIVNIISELLQSNTGSSTSVIRNSNNEPGLGGKRDIMKIVTSDILVDSLPAFKEKFLLGYYLLEDTSYVIKPEKMNFKVESQISIRGQDFYVDFTVIGETKWAVYQINKKGEFKIQPESIKSKIGVGKYKSQKEVISKSRIGNDVVDYETFTVNVKDQPISKGVLEDDLFNQIMDKFAINNIFAQAYLQ